MVKLQKFIGEKIKFYRLKKDLNQDELAEMLGTTKQTVSRYEKGDRQANQDILFELAKIFNISIDDFFPERNTVQIAAENSAPYITNNESHYTYFPTGFVSAGLPWDVDGITNNETIKLPNSAMGKYAGNKDIIVLRVNGDSMDKVIPDGSLIAVKPVNIELISDGDIVVFSNNHEYSVKYYYRQDEKIIFKPSSDNAAHFDQAFNVDDDVTIHGKVVMYIVNLD